MNVVHRAKFQDLYAHKQIQTGWSLNVFSNGKHFVDLQPPTSNLNTTTHCQYIKTPKCQTLFDLAPPTEKQTTAAVNARIARM